MFLAGGELVSTPGQNVLKRTFLQYMSSQYAQCLALNNIPVVLTFTEKLSSDPKRKDMLTVVY